MPIPGKSGEEPHFFGALRFAPVAALLLGHILTGGELLAATLERESVTVEGTARSFALYLPADYDSQEQYPILIVLHGGEGDGLGTAERTGFADYVDGDQFIAVFPDAGGRQWNDGRETTRSNADDVAFLEAVVQSVVEMYGGDPAHVFVAGGSNGGMMTQRLACERSDLFAGFAAVNANMPAGLAGGCRPSRARPFAFFFGTEDPIMPPSGGEVRSARRAGMGAGGEVIPAADTVRFWTEANRCGGSSERAVPDHAEDDGTTVRQVTYQTCADATQVVEFEVVGGGHTWPGSAPPERALLRRIVGVTSQDIDATGTIIAFFRAYGL